MKVTRFLVTFAVMALAIVGAQAAGLLDAQPFFTPDMQIGLASLGDASTLFTPDMHLGGLGLAGLGAAGITKYVQDGHCLDLSPNVDVASGVGFLFGAALFGVAAKDVAANATGSFVTEGVVTIGKTSALAIAVGDRLYWDAVNKVVNKTAAAQQHVGIAVEAAANPSATVKMKLVTNVALAA